MASPLQDWYSWPFTLRTLPSLIISNSKPSEFSSILLEHAFSNFSTPSSLSACNYQHPPTVCPNSPLFPLPCCYLSTLILCQCSFNCLLLLISFLYVRIPFPNECQLNISMASHNKYIQNLTTLFHTPKHSNRPVTTMVIFLFFSNSCKMQSTTKSPWILDQSSTILTLIELQTLD